MNICFLVGTLARGGAEKQLVYMLRALKNAAVETRVLCLTHGEFYESEIEALGIEIEYVGKSRTRAVRLAKVIRSLQKQPVDLVQSSHFYTNIYAGLAGKILSIPSIGAVRNDLKSEIESHGMLGKFQLMLPDFLIANSRNARRNAVRRGIALAKIEFVSNAVEAAPDESQNAANSEQTLTFLFAGRLSRQKRPDRFVRLAAALVKKFPQRELRFLIAGDGELKSEIERQAQNSASAGKIVFLGACSNMAETYRQADLLVLTSDYEGTPNVVLEAMAHGLPVIAAGVGGTPDILNDKCGILFEPNDENGLFKAACKLIEHPELRFSMGLQALDYVGKNHSLDCLKNRLIEIYARLIKTGAAAEIHSRRKPDPGILLRNAADD